MPELIVFGWGLAFAVLVPDDGLTLAALPGGFSALGLVAGRAAPERPLYLALTSAVTLAAQAIWFFRAT